jgi:hypothetical protein
MLMTPGPTSQENQGRTCMWTQQGHDILLMKSYARRLIVVKVLCKPCPNRGLSMCGNCNVIACHCRTHIRTRTTHSIEGKISCLTKHITCLGVRGAGAALYAHTVRCAQSCLS